MATRRVILKLKKPFSKGKVLGTGAEMRRYLHHLFPPGQMACLYSGGFLQGKPSASPQEETNQRDWVTRMTRKWSTELAGKSRRTNDGLRFTLSLLPDARRDLADSRHCATQALLEIWQKTIELLRLRRAWAPPAGELGWICGSLHDAGNAQLKIILFPTTKDGQVLHDGADGNENVLSEVFATANLAAEIYWRDHLGVTHQDPDYQKTISKVPIYEPPLPSCDSLTNRKSVANRKKGNRREPLQINTALIARDALSDTMISINMESPLMRPAHEGIRRLKSLAAINIVFDNVNWLVHALIGNRTAKDTLEVQEKLPDEFLIIKNLIEDLGHSKHPPTRQLVSKILKNDLEPTLVALYLAVGIQDSPSNETSLKIGAKLAEIYQKVSKGTPDQNLDVYWKKRNRFKVRATKTKVHACFFRNALRAIAPNHTESRLGRTLVTLIRGTERISHFLDAIYDEISISINPAGTNGLKNIQNLEWSIDNGQMVRKPFLGAPWPPHFDPLTVFVPLMSLEPKASEPTLGEAAPAEAPPSRYSANPGVLNRMIRITQSKAIDRQQRIKECMLDRGKA